MKPEDFKKSGEKVVIIGIDSATFDIINPIIRDGGLTNLARLMENGASGLLKSTIPPVTPPAWVSFMTGKNPGKHGVFDFYVSPSHGYSRPIWNSKYIKSKTIWRLLSDNGFKVGVINLPMTYPPENINGFMIPGMQYSFDNGGNFSHPPELMQEIKEKIGDYRVVYGDMESIYTNNLDRLLKEWIDIFEIRRKAILYLMDNKEWDVFMPVFYSIDVMQHHFWKFFDKTHPLYDLRLNKKYANIIPEFYRKIDTVIGEVLQRLDNRTTVIIVSDHGAGAEETGFSINKWLNKEGFLSFQQTISPLWRFRFPHLLYKTLRRLRFPGIAWTVPLDQLKALGKAIDPREGLNIPFFIDWRRTRAYGGNHTEQGIYINLKGREPMGIVEIGREYEEVRETIIERLRGIKDPKSGKPLDITIYKKEEVYHGPYIDNAPDIFIEINGGRCLMQKEIYNCGLFHNAYKSSGTHRMNGIFVMKGNGIRANHSLEGIKIVDLAPTILYLLGIPIPEDMDGKVIVSAFEKDYLSCNPVSFAPSAEIEVGTEEGIMNSEESEKAKKSLRDLGYFG